MKKRLWASMGVVLLAVGLLAGGSIVVLRSVQAETRVKEAAEFKSASSRIDHVTVYQNNALVTREVDVPELIAASSAAAFWILSSSVSSRTNGATCWGRGTCRRT